MIDNETSLKNTDPESRTRLLDHIWNGPWMPEIRRLLPDPKLICVEIQFNGCTSKGHIHRDNGDHQIWNVVVPLGQEGTKGKIGGTYVFSRDSSKGQSVACERNRYAIWPAHHFHYREPSHTVEASKLRRIMLISFGEQERLPNYAYTIARRHHSRLKAGGIKKRPPPHTMTLRRRPKCEDRGSRHAIASLGTTTQAEQTGSPRL